MTRAGDFVDYYEKIENLDGSFSLDGPHFAIVLAADFPFASIEIHFNKEFFPEIENVPYWNRSSSEEIPLYFWSLPSDRPCYDRFSRIAESVAP